MVFPPKSGNPEAGASVAAGAGAAVGVAAGPQAVIKTPTRTKKLRIRENLFIFSLLLMVVQAVSDGDSVAFSNLSIDEFLLLCKRNVRVFRNY
jgi:hypothetical protein